MKQLSFQFPTPELRANRPAFRTRNSKLETKSITWQMSESEADFLVKSLNDLTPWYGGGGAA